MGIKKELPKVLKRAKIIEKEFLKQVKYQRELAEREINSLKNK